ncbi:MAG: hypothetical protein EAZ91_01060 [Cytophagales bacterium]|nr:MAG: hypothetical protein EAZ91_01060 [Cytophagales bacterium]
MFRFYALLISVLLPYTSYAQTNLPIIRATSKNVAIRDGDFLDKEGWSLSPGLRPDVYTADRSRKPKWVVFYTDVDSIRTRVVPGSSFDFVILLNGKDSCFTRIESAIPPATAPAPRRPTHDTIPFTLSAHNAIHVRAILNERDTLSLHFDTGSFDFRLTHDAILKRTNLLANQPDALAGKAKPVFSKMEKVRLFRLGKLNFANPTVVPTLLTAHGMDGRFGWNLFEGKVVEIDYDKELLIIHSERPKHARTYQKTELDFLRSFPCMKGTLQVAGRQLTGWFSLDTGSDKALILDSVWVRKQGFPTDLPLIRETSLRNPRGEVFVTKTVRCPGFSMANLSLKDPPATLLVSRNPANFEINFLGNDILKRFNTILDFQNDLAYLKPNRHYTAPFLEMAK